MQSSMLDYPIDSYIAVFFQNILIADAYEHLPWFECWLVVLTWIGSWSGKTSLRLLFKPDLNNFNLN